jgi:hypothetical protein
MTLAKIVEIAAAMYVWVHMSGQVTPEEVLGLPQ